MWRVQNTIIRREKINTKRNPGTNGLWLTGIPPLQIGEGVISSLIWTLHFNLQSCKVRKPPVSKKLQGIGRNWALRIHVFFFFFLPFLFWQMSHFRKVTRVIQWTPFYPSPRLTATFCHIRSVCQSVCHPPFAHSPINLQHSCPKNKNILTNNHKFTLIHAVI